MHQVERRSDVNLRPLYHASLVKRLAAHHSAVRVEILADSALFSGVLLRIGDLDLLRLRAFLERDGEFAIASGCGSGYTVY
jgi:hypothetical protein